MVDYRERVDYTLHERASKRADEIYDKKIKGRRPDDFIGGQFYTKDAIDGINEKVEWYEKTFAEQAAALDADKREKQEMSAKLAHCLEGIILNAKTWFGPTQQVYPTTKWDDYYNGVDLVAERMSGGVMSHHGFALDITYAGRNVIARKINKIVDRIRQGKLGKVDFFKSNDGTFKGQLGEIPLVVIGADGNTMKGFVNLFAEKEDEKIEDHPVQFQIIDQVLMQCDFFIRIAEQIQNPVIRDKIIKAYETLKKDFELIKRLKAKISGDLNGTFRDTFHENMTQVLGEVK